MKKRNNTLIKALSLILCSFLLLPMLFSCNTTPPVGKIEAETTEGGFILENSGFSGDTLPPELQTVSVTPTSKTGSRINADSSFIIETAENTDAMTLLSHLNLYPETEYDIETVSDSKFLVTPRCGLEKNKVYKISLGNGAASFAFQTETALDIKSALPRDGATAVPLNTGIEITFTDTITSAADIKDYIEITPKIDCDIRLYPSGRTLVIIPKSKLEKSTTYKVTLKEGLPSSSDTLKEEISVVFRTISADQADIKDINYSLYLRTVKEFFTSKENPIIRFSFNSYNRKNSPKAELGEISAEIYKYKSQNDLINAIKEAYENAQKTIESGEDYKYPTKGTEKIGSFKLEEEDDGSSYVSLPISEKGAYLVKLSFKVKTSAITSETVTYYRIVQITDLMLYSETTDRDIAILAAKSGSAAPLSGLSVNIETFSYNSSAGTPNELGGYTKITKKTDKNGFTSLEKSDDKLMLIYAKDGKDELTVLSDSSYRSEQEYESYVYTDREAYFPNDKINFTLYLSPKAKDEMPERVYYSINYSGKKLPLSQIDSGVYTGSYLLEDFMGGGISLIFYDEDGKAINSKWLQVTEENKPVYSVSIEFDKLFYRYGEKGVATLTAKFFDGTPAQGLSFEFNGNNININLSGSTRVVTDKKGKIEIPFTATYTGSTTSYPTQVYISANQTGYEDVPLRASASAVYIFSTVDFTSERIYENGKSYTNVYLKERVVDSLRSEADLKYPLFPDNTVGDAKDGTVKVVLRKYVYTKIKIGTEYDPITKTTYERYRTQINEHIEKSFQGEIKNGVLTLPHYKVEGFQGYYSYEISYSDTKGGHSYTLHSYAVEGQKTAYNYTDYKDYELILNNDSYSVGDRVVLTVESSDSGKADSVFAMLTVVTHKGVTRYFSYNGEFSFDFTEIMKRGARAFLTVNDGEKLYYNRDIFIPYDSKDSELSLEIIPEKDKYRPGDEATVTVRVTDKKTGQPVSDALITLSIADEACFAIADQSVNTLSVLYPQNAYILGVSRGIYRPLTLETSVRSEFFYSSPTMDLAESASGIEKDSISNGEDVYLREKFSDNPVYVNLKTDKDGILRYTYKAPDNITGWRITAVAFADSKGETNVMTGSSVSSLVTTLPAFINPVVSGIYIEGDEITASARLAGNDINGTEKVTYEAELLLGNERIKKIKETSSADDIVFFNFGKREAGSYSIVITARCGDYADAVRKELSVIKSAVSAPVSKELEIKNIKSISPTEYPITLTFFSRNQSEFFSYISRLRSTKLSRADAVAASYGATMLLETVTGNKEQTEKLAGSIKTGFSANITEGLVSLLPYSEGDVKLTALILLASPEILSEHETQNAIASLSSVIYSNVTDAVEFSYALLGLAAAGEPVLTDLYYVASNCKSFPLEAKLAISAAFAAIGDYSSASQIFSELKEEFAISSAKDIYFEGKSAEDSILLSYTALLSAAVVDRESAEGILSYLNNRTSSLDIYPLHILWYLKNAKPEDADPITLVYELNGEKKEAILENGSRLSLSLDRASFESLKVEENSAVTCIALYNASITDATMNAEEDKNLSIEKSISPVIGKRGIYRVSLTYRVTTSKDYTSFRLSDTIPAGARFWQNERHNNYSNTWGYIGNNGGSSMEGYVSVSNRTKDLLGGRQQITVTGTVTYLIRTALPGTYISDSALLSSYDGASFAVSKRENAEFE